MSHVIGSIASWLLSDQSWCARSNESLIILSPWEISSSLCFASSDNLFSASSISLFTFLSFCIVTPYSWPYTSHSGAELPSDSSNQKWLIANAHNQTNTIIKNKFFMYHIYTTVRNINLIAVASINNTSTMLDMYVLCQSIDASSTKLHSAITKADSVGLVNQSSNQNTISAKYGTLFCVPIGFFCLGYLGVTIPIVSSCWCLLLSSPALSINWASWLDTTLILSLCIQSKDHCDVLHSFHYKERCAFLRGVALNTASSCQSLPLLPLC